MRPLDAARCPDVSLARGSPERPRPKAAGVEGRRRGATVTTIYRRLRQACGPQHWWPAQTPFEVMVGAILTQATAWHNAQQAVARLRRAGGLTGRGLLALTPARLVAAVRPAGFGRQKARRLRTFARWLVAEHAGEASRLFRRPWQAVRRELLTLPGIGPETADAMLLYAGGQPVFVVDAYTRRVFRRHGLAQGREPYDTVQALVMRRLRGARQYNEFHALLVETGKRWCHRRDPDCVACPLGVFPRRLTE